MSDGKEIGSGFLPPTFLDKPDNFSMEHDWPSHKVSKLSYAEIIVEAVGMTETFKLN